MKHAAFFWKKTLLIWGGYDAVMFDYDVSVVYCFRSGKWIRKQTSGDVPADWVFNGNAQVIDDTMFVLDIDSVYRLDLNTWTWRRFTPSGVPPRAMSSHSQSWVHNDKIYCFGPFPFRFRFFCYNISSNSWEWPNHTGEMPISGYVKAIISGDTVFLMSCDDNCFFTLDMTTMIWREVHGTLSDRPELTPWCKGGITLTRISQSAAVLFGTTPHGSCWLLNLKNAKQLKDPSAIWTKVPCRFARYGHAAVWNPQNQELWVTGGRDTYSDVLIMSFKLPALKRLALDSAARSVCTCDPKLAADQLPTQLKNELVEYRSEFSDVYSLVNKVKMCTSCQEIGGQ